MKACTCDGDRARVFPEGADVDDRIFGVVVDVGIGRVDPLTPRARASRAVSAPSARECRIVRRAERHAWGSFAVRRPHGRAALEIGADHAAERQRAAAAGSGTAPLQSARPSDGPADHTIDHDEAACTSVRDRCTNSFHAARREAGILAEATNEDELSRSCPAASCDASRSGRPPLRRAGGNGDRLRCAAPAGSQPCGRAGHACSAYGRRSRTDVRNRKAESSWGRHLFSV